MSNRPGLFLFEEDGVEVAEKSGQEKGQSPTDRVVADQGIGKEDAKADAGDDVDDGVVVGVLFEVGFGLLVHEHRSKFIRALLETGGKRTYKFSITNFQFPNNYSNSKFSKWEMVA